MGTGVYLFGNKSNKTTRCVELYMDVQKGLMCSCCCSMYLAKWHIYMYKQIRKSPWSMYTATG